MAFKRKLKNSTIGKFFRNIISKIVNISGSSEGIRINELVPETNVNNVIEVIKDNENPQETGSEEKLTLNISDLLLKKAKKAKLDENDLKEIVSNQDCFSSVVIVDVLLAVYNYSYYKNNKFNLNEFSEEYEEFLKKRLFPQLIKLICERDYDSVKVLSKDQFSQYVKKLKKIFYLNAVVFISFLQVIKESSGFNYDSISALKDFIGKSSNWFKKIIIERSIDDFRRFDITPCRFYRVLSHANYSELFTNAKLYGLQKKIVEFWLSNRDVTDFDLLELVEDIPGDFGKNLMQCLLTQKNLKK